jgi:hypothetical protein
MAATASPSYAQGTRSGGLFGATRSDTGRGDTFNVTFTASEAYDTEVPAEFRNRISQSGPQSGGYSTMLSTALEYSNIGRRGRITGTGQTAFRYYQRVSELSSVSHNGAVGARWDFNRNTNLSLNQTAAYSPSYLYQLFPGVTVPEPGVAPVETTDYRVHETESYNYGTNVSLGIGSARRNRFTVSGDYRHTDHRRELVERPDLSVYTGRAKYARGLGRSASLSAEYEYKTGEFGFGQAVENRLNIGAEYSMALATSRRATFRFEIGPSALDISEAAVNAPVTGRIYRVQGEGAIDYQFRRTWRAGASFRRSLEYVPLFVEPIYADSARLELSGLITRRVDVSAAAGLAQGESALNRLNSSLDTYTATARARFAMTRSLALYTEYLYYYYDLRGQSALAPDLPPTVDQHSVRVGLTLWIPIR